MCISEGMGIAPWGAIGAGAFQRKADQGKSKDGRSAKELNENEIKVSAALEKVADEIGIESVTAVALAWVMSKYPYVYPIVGGRKVEYVSFPFPWRVSIYCTQGADLVLGTLSRTCNRSRLP